MTIVSIYTTLDCHVIMRPLGKHTLIGFDLNHRTCLHLYKSHIEY